MRIVSSLVSEIATLIPQTVPLTLIPDDSFGNCKSSQELGWTTAHLVEDEVTPPKTPASKYQIRHLEELRGVFPQFFKPTA